MFDFIKKIKKLFSGKNSSTSKKGQNSRSGKNTKSSSRPAIPPSRDHEFKRSRPGTQEPRDNKKRDRDQQPRKSADKRSKSGRAGVPSPAADGEKNSSPITHHSSPDKKRSDKPRRDSFSEHRERRERYADRKKPSKPETSLQDKEVKISPELVLTDWNPADFVVEPVEGKKRFHDFNLPEPIMHAVYDLGFKYCTPIQAASLEKSLAGANVAGRAQTGTGKTAAYLLTILTRYLNQCTISNVQCTIPSPAPADSADGSRPATAAEPESTAGNEAASVETPAEQNCTLNIENCKFDKPAAVPEQPVAAAETAEDGRACRPATAAEPESSADNVAASAEPPAKQNCTLNIENCKLDAAAQQQRPCGAPRALVIAPTRELCVQIANDAKALGKYCGLRSMAVFGGMDYARQARELQEAPLDLLAATPGRLLDFQRQHIVDLSKIDTLVIDEADRMLDMGFIPDVRRIIRCLPTKRQTLLYSATLDDEVMRLASQWMPDPVKVEIEPEKTANQSIDQKVYIVTSNQKFTILCHLLEQFDGQRVLVFGNRRVSTDHLAESLRRQGYECELLSGEVSQAHRMKVLDAFREGSVKLVVATDVAGRGLHIADIGLVVNFELPYEAEDYVHRIGRTGRAGKVGTAVSFADEDESFIIPDIETYIGEELKCTTPDEALLAPLPRRKRRAEKENSLELRAKSLEPHSAEVPASENDSAPEGEGGSRSCATAESEVKSEGGRAGVPPPAAVPEQPVAAAENADDGRAVCPHTAAEPTSKADSESPAAEPPAKQNCTLDNPAAPKEPVRDISGPRGSTPARKAEPQTRAASPSRTPKAVVMPKGGMRSQVWSPGQK